MLLDDGMEGMLSGIEHNAATGQYVDRRCLGLVPRNNATFPDQWQDLWVQFACKPGQTTIIAILAMPVQIP